MYNIEKPNSRVQLKSKRLVRVDVPCLYPYSTMKLSRPTIEIGMKLSRSTTKLGY